MQASFDSQQSIVVHRTLVCDVPESLNLDDPSLAADAGAWLNERLAEAEFSLGRGPLATPATLAIGREHVILKRIILPTADAGELPDMTRLAMQRELPFDAEAAVIDFVPVEQHESSTTVVAVAVPRPRIDALLAIAHEAGLKVQRIALRTMGAAALLNTLGDAHAHDAVVEDLAGESMGEDGGDQGERADAHPTVMPGDRRTENSASLIVDVVGEGVVEFVVLDGGTIRMSRAAEVPMPQDALSMAQAVVTEARRTWMSYRSASQSSAIASQSAASAAMNAAGGIGEAVIVGERRVAEYAGERVGEMLGLPVRVLTSHPRVKRLERGPRSLPKSTEGLTAMDDDFSLLWPLAGLLLEGVMRGERIDFLHPRQAPDRRAQARKRGLLIAAMIAIAIGGTWTMMRRDLQKLNAQTASLESAVKSGDAGFARHHRDVFRIEHLTRWEQVRVEWLDHATFLAKVAPPPEQVVLDSWSGVLEGGEVRYDGRSHRWNVAHQATIVIDGEARDRATADAFREALIRNPVYVASTTGADTRGGKRMPFGFTYRLRTRASEPPIESESEADNPEQASVQTSMLPTVHREPSRRAASTPVGGEG